jgi:hypothetical protein
MAQSLETLRSANITSLFGRRLGLQQDETIAGTKGLKEVVQDLTSASTGTAVNNYGMVVARISGSMTTATANFLLSNPIPGVDVRLCYAQTSQAASAGSTGIAFSRPTTAFYIQSTDGSTGVAVLLTYGSMCTLRGVSTDAYMFIRHGTSGAVVVGTS